MAALTIGACAPTPGSQTSTSPPASSSPSQIAPVAVAPFPNCHLPFLVVGDAQAPMRGGFVSTPAGRFAADPKGRLTDAYQGTPVTVATPVLHGSFSQTSGSYDATVQRWLPVSNNLVRGDGLAYAYAEGYKANPKDQLESRTHIHVVSLPSGADRIIYSGGPYQVLAWEPEGLYLVAVSYYAGEGSSGLWRLNPKTGAVVKLYDNFYFTAVGGGIGWVLNTGIAPSTLSKVDLATGTTQEWANTGSQGWINFMGADKSGHPFVSIQGIEGVPSQLMLYSAPHQPRSLGRFTAWYTTSATDAHGQWFGGQDGIYLYTDELGLRKVSDVGQGIAAGPCQ